MRLWTYQPPGFRIDDPGLVIDPTKGPYWNEPLTPRYREALQELCKRLGLDRFPLWSCTVADAWPIDAHLVLEWELNVPDSQILAFIREPIWDAIVKGKRNDWANVIVTERPVQPDRNITALVRVPLSLEWVKCHGKLVRPEWRKDAELLKTRPDLHQPYINRYRDIIADPKASPIERKMYAERIQYLEEILGLKSAK